MEFEFNIFWIPNFVYIQYVVNIVCKAKPFLEQCGQRNVNKLKYGVRRTVFMDTVL